MRMLTAGAVLIAAVQTTSPAGCAPLPKACDLSFQGIYIEAGEVWDVVTVTCEVPPLEHYIQAWMEYKRFDNYDSYGPHIGTRKIPGTTGFELKVHSACVEGWFRSKVHVRAVVQPIRRTPRASLSTSRILGGRSSSPRSNAQKGDDRWAGASRGAGSDVGRTR